MAYKVSLSLQAREDLRDIVRFIREDNPAVASRVGYTLIKRVDVLEVFPLFGRRVPEFDDEDIRELIDRPYRIIYQVIEAQRLIAIARVWHGARGEPELPAQLQF